MRNVRATRNIHQGFDATGTDGLSAAHTFYEACISDKNGAAAYEFDGTKYNSIFNSIAQDNAGAGLMVKGGAKTTLVESNRFYNNGKCGIEFQAGSEHALLKSNVVINSTHAGICLNEVAYVKTFGLKVRNTYENAAFCFSLTTVRGFVNVNSTCNVLDNVEYWSGVSTPPPPTPTPSPTAKPSLSYDEALALLDPGCEFGIAQKSVCCPKHCGTCGGLACNVQSPSKFCCPEAIKQLSGSCNTNPPPCVLGFVGNIPGSR